VVADTLNPAGGFTSEEYRDFGTRFDQLVYPLAVQTFGEPSDLDGNQRVIIFFTRAVNDLTRPGDGFYVGASSTTATSSRARGATPAPGATSPRCST
jgi:hypothetical protein